MNRDNLSENNIVYHKYLDAKAANSDGNGGLFVTLKGVAKSLCASFAKLFQGAVDSNHKVVGKYITEGQNIMKFPLLVSEEIDAPIVAKFCAFLQQERAEHIRTFFYNRDITLGFNKSQMAKEFGTRFYEDVNYEYNENDIQHISEDFQGSLFEKLQALRESDADDEYEDPDLAFKYNKLRADNASKISDRTQRERHHKETLDQRNKHHEETLKQKRQEFINNHYLNAKKFEYQKDKDEKDYTQRERQFIAKQDLEDRKLAHQERHHSDRLGLDKDKLAHQVGMDHAKHELDKEKHEYQKTHDKAKLDLEIDKEAARMAHADKRDEENHKRALEKMELEHELRSRLNKRDELSLNSSANQSSLNQNGGLRLKGRDLMPIVPTMINVVGTENITGKQLFQILGIRYIPHSIPSSEIRVAFKYGILNNRTVLRFIKLICGDLGFFDFLLGKDRRAINAMMTKISSNEKAWNVNLKNSSQAVTFIISKNEYDEICKDIVDLSDSNKFKRVQKDIGLLDLIVVDKNAKEFMRINAAEGYNSITHDMRDVLNANERDLVINARIDSHKLHSEA